ncbi:hypothetical protein ABFV99_14050 [Cytobacillus horneckiae]|uniref:hypothetical protein n=1 Tax=Cytobacillus horneckiae TaxID=549687 RepID=UPI0034CF56C8
MSNAKVKLTKEQASAFKRFELKHINKRSMLDRVLINIAFKGKLAPLNQIEIHDLLQAIFIGYEIDLTPAEKIKRVISEMEDDISRSLPMHEEDKALINGYIRGLKKALSYIEGNSNE